MAFTFLTLLEMVFRWVWSPPLSWWFFFIEVAVFTLLQLVRNSMVSGSICDVYDDGVEMYKLSYRLWHLSINRIDQHDQELDNQSMYILRSIVYLNHIPILLLDDQQRWIRFFCNCFLSKWGFEHHIEPSPLDKCTLIRCYLNCLLQ